MWEGEWMFFAVVNDIILCMQYVYVAVTVICSVVYCRKGNDMYDV